MKTIKITYLSAKGLTTKNFDETLALEEIRKACKENDSWLYLDNEYILDTDNVTLQTLLNADSIIISNPLIGA